MPWIELSNLTDYQFFLFEESQAPALVILYHKEKPADSSQLIDYWAPKTDLTVAQVEIATVLPQDRSRITVREIMDDLNGEDAPLIWKERFWATPRDRQLLDRLSLFPRLRSIVGSPSDKVKKRWTIGQGFEERNEQTYETKKLIVPTEQIIEARDSRLQLFLLKGDCASLPSREVKVRKRSNTNTDVYLGPHVLISHGFSNIAFADFDVSFRHALRGIHGPVADQDLLVFLTAYLRSDVARYFLFHTSSNWGVSRAKVHVEELLRLPFPLPEDTHNPKRCQAIIREVAVAVMQAAEEASRILADREGIVRYAQESVGRLIEEYFDIDNIERMLITDTAKIIIPSVRPSRGKENVPTIKQGSAMLRASYTSLLCERPEWLGEAGIQGTREDHGRLGHRRWHDRSRKD